MQEYTLKSDAKSSNTKKDGTPLVGKFGPYFIIRYETVEEGWVSTFGKIASTLKAGDKITGTIEVKEANGFTNKNFTPAKPTDDLADKIMKLQKDVTTLNLSVERRVGERFLELKADLVLELTGKFNLKKDLEKSDANVAHIVTPQVTAEEYPEDLPF